MTSYISSKRRPVRNKEGFRQAYNLWSQDEPIGTIIEKTKVSDKTITNWVNMFKEAPEEETAKDKQFRFFGLKAFPSFDWTLLDRMREVTGEFKNEKGEKLIPINIEDEMKSAYIDYSMSVIVSRALPDVRLAQPPRPGRSSRRAVAIATPSRRRPGGDAWDTYSGLLDGAKMARARHRK